MLYLPSRALFHLFAQSTILKRLASRFGMATPDSFARRFVAGESIDEALDTALALRARGLQVTLDYLGESAATPAEADTATRDYLQVLDRIAASDIDRHVSLKLTQLGLDVDRATCMDNIRRILEAADGRDFFVCIDMEDSRHTEVTLETFETLWRHDHRNIGIVLQSCLYRTDDDIRRILATGASIRLVKGAYRETSAVAHLAIADVNAAFLRMMRMLLDHGHDPAIATHDLAMIDETIAYAASRGIAPDRFEFQLLHGVRRDLQADLVARGFRVRVYVPFGQQWFPYFMRRLGERPANVAFVIRSLWHERRTGTRVSS